MGAEGRVGGELAQPGCAMTGFIAHLAEMSESVAVIVFGERDCVNAFSRQNASVRFKPKWNIFTTALRETDVVAGAAEARLEECLRAVANEHKDKPIVVLTTCLTQMIAADAAAVCKRVGEELHVRVVTIETSGLMPRSQAEIDDWFAQVMVTDLANDEPLVPDPGEAKPKAVVNLFGYFGERTHGLDMPGFAIETREVLRRAGVVLNAFTGLGAPYQEWARMAYGEITALPEMALFPRLVSALLQRGQRVIELPPPKGITATDTFYTRLGEAIGVDLRAVLECVEARQNALAFVESCRQRFSGKRLVYGIGSHHNFREDMLVWEGLGDLPLWKELGFDVELVIQERDTPETHERIQRNLRALGLDMKYRLFYEPAVLAPAIRDGGYDYAYLVDFLAEQARQAGVRMIKMGCVPPGYSGIRQAVSAIDRASDSPFEMRYSRYMKGGR